MLIVLVLVALISACSSGANNGGEPVVALSDPAGFLRAQGFDPSLAPIPEILEDGRIEFAEFESVMQSVVDCLALRGFTGVEYTYNQTYQVFELTVPGDASTAMYECELETQYAPLAILWSEYDTLFTEDLELLEQKTEACIRSRGYDLTHDEAFQSRDTDIASVYSECYEASIDELRNR